MKVLIDNGHGIETLGKRSPDGRLKEYAYTREVADRVVKALTAAGIDAVRIVPEDADVPLSERCTRANALYTESGKQAILVSIHCNAAGNGSADLQSLVVENPHTHIPRIANSRRRKPRRRRRRRRNGTGKMANGTTKGGFSPCDMWYFAMRKV